MIDSVFKAIYVTRKMIWKKCSEVLDEFSAFCRMSARPMRLAFVIAFALGAATVWADNSPETTPTVTVTTPIPVPNAWLAGYPALLTKKSGDYEAAANATAANGRKVWECYATGVDPSEPVDGPL